MGGSAGASKGDTGGKGSTGGQGGAGAGGGTGGSAPMTCASPSDCTLPPSTCDGNNLVFYTTPACTSGACSSTKQSAPCAGMCMDGMCVPPSGGSAGAGGA